MKDSWKSSLQKYYRIKIMGNAKPTLPPGRGGNHPNPPDCPPSQDWPIGPWEKNNHPKIGHFAQNTPVPDCPPQNFFRGPRPPKWSTEGGGVRAIANLISGDADFSLHEFINNASKHCDEIVQSSDFIHIFFLVFRISNTLSFCIFLG